MNKEKLTEEISVFRDEVGLFKELLLRSRDSAMPEIVRNHDEIAGIRRALVRKYASLERYLDKLGKRPKMRDGVNPEYYPVYHNAFSTDILLRVGPSLEAIEQDLDYVLGKLESMSEDELTGLLKNKELADPKTIASVKTNNENVKNLHKQYWGKLLSDIWAWIKEYILATVIAGLILAGLVYLFGWN